MEATWGGVESERGRMEELGGEGEGLGRYDPRSDRAGGLTPASRAEWAGLMGQVGQVQPRFSELAK
jgi:hypothetical protein